MKAHMNLSQVEKEAAEKEIRRIMAEWVEEHKYDIDKIALYILHEHFGFGQKRCRRFWELMQGIRDELNERYCGMGDLDFQCDISLNDAGINVEKWDRELQYGNNR